MAITPERPKDDKPDIGVVSQLAKLFGLDLAQTVRDAGPPGLLLLGALLVGIAAGLQLSWALAPGLGVVALAFLWQVGLWRNRSRLARPAALRRIGTRRRVWSTC